jgi:hydrogenase/urease accessory protein HupE
VKRSCLALFLALCVCGKLAAHELRPAYLELREEKQGDFSVLWKTPARGEVHLSLAPEFDARTENITPVSTRMTDTAALQTWRLRALEPLRGTTLRIGGLAGTMTDALVRIEFADGTSWTQRLTPQQPIAVIPAQQGRFSVAGVYLKLGVEHILTGIDHLLFILALIIITRGGWKLVKTVTAFTVSHSITLTAATLGFVHVPQRPVEAVIALSIVFVACEIVHRRQGCSGLTERWPWIVALTFGLLHGLGFAGALSEVGLPQGHIPLALLFFSVGVEIGQLMFIAAVLSLVAVMQRVRIPIPRWGEFVPPYAIGTVAMFWIIQRVAVF